jgi:hypothetical protein
MASGRRKCYEENNTMVLCCTTVAREGLLRKDSLGGDM